MGTINPAHLPGETGVGTINPAHAPGEMGTVSAQVRPTRPKIPAGEAQRDFPDPCEHVPSPSGHGPGTRLALRNGRGCSIIKGRLFAGESAHSQPLGCLF